MKFHFSKQLKADLANNGKDWCTLLFKACTEAKGSDVKASQFCEVLRASGFKCGTGPARTAYKAVRDGGDQKAMTASIEAVKTKRKASKGKDGAGAGADTPDTLVGALNAALHAAQAGNLAVVESWLVKATALIATAKTTTKQAIERMGGLPETEKKTGAKKSA